MKRTTARPIQCELLTEHALEAMIVRAVDLLKEHEPPDGYYGCFSGGKDSCVIKELARLAGVKATWHYNVTTVDPPELIWFMKEHHKDVDFLYPNMRMFDEIPKRGLPTRRVRWCCEVFKESRNPKGATLIMGIRAEESPRRASIWSEVEYHHRTKCNCVLPIFKWTIDHVWEFIRVQKLAYCSLYDEGFKRLGCIGCPMAGVAGRIKEFSRWPGIEQQYKDATRKLFETNMKEHVQLFPSWESLWEWWLSDDPAPAAPCGELKLFEPEAEP